MEDRNQCQIKQAPKKIQPLEQSRLPPGESRLSLSCPATNWLTFLDGSSGIMDCSGIVNCSNPSIYARNSYF